MNTTNRSQNEHSLLQYVRVVTFRGSGMIALHGEFCGLAEAATRKGVHYQTVRRAIIRGDFKAMKVGGGA